MTCDSADPSNTRRWPSVGSMLVRRRRRRANIESTLGQHLMFAGLCHSLGPGNLFTFCYGSNMLAYLSCHSIPKLNLWGDMSRRVCPIRRENWINPFIPILWLSPLFEAGDFWRNFQLQAEEFLFFSNTTQPDRKHCIYSTLFVFCLDPIGPFILAQTRVNASDIFAHSPSRLVNFSIMVEWLTTWLRMAGGQTGRPTTKACYHSFKTDKPIIPDCHRTEWETLLYRAVRCRCSGGPPFPSSAQLQGRIGPKCLHDLVYVSSFHWKSNMAATGCFQKRWLGGQALAQWWYVSPPLSQRWAGVFGFLWAVFACRSAPWQIEQDPEGYTRPGVVTALTLPQSWARIPDAVPALRWCNLSSRVGFCRRRGLCRATDTAWIFMLPCDI